MYNKYLTDTQFLHDLCNTPNVQYFVDKAHVIYRTDKLYTIQSHSTDECS